MTHHCFKVSRVLQRGCRHHHYCDWNGMKRAASTTVRSFGSSSNTEQRQPILNASAWLDPQKYCIQTSSSASTSISGSDASTRLHQGRLSFQKELCETNSFTLTGHGVPILLLQDHIDMADSLLQHFNDDNTTHKNDNTNPNNITRNVVPPSISFSNLDGFLTFQRIRIRHSNGDSTIIPWRNVMKDPDMFSIQDRIELCLTVMNRIATRLGLLVLHEYDAISSSVTSNCIVANSWNMELSTTPQQLPLGQTNNTNIMVQVSKQSNHKNTHDDSCHIRIYLRGIPSSTTSTTNSAINIVFDTYLDENKNLTQI